MYFMPLCIVYNYVCVRFTREASVVLAKLNKVIIKVKNRKSATQQSVN